MHSFCSRVADELIKETPASLDRCCVVFPSRRAALIFRYSLAQKLASPAFAPFITSIRDFTQQLSGITIEREITLLFQLFDVYKKHFPKTSFDSYFHWGRMMLSDFNDIDMNLVNARNLFSNIAELKRIETEFGLDAEQAEAISRFWKKFSEKELLPHRKQFLNTWLSLYEIYSDFNLVLKEQDSAYEGLVCRRLVEAISENKIKVDFHKIIFAGFYGMPAAHLKMIELLKKTCAVQMIYDCDHYYLDNPAHEAGEYFRNAMRKGEPVQAQYFIRDKQRHVTIAGVPLFTGQAKFAGEFLESLIKSKGMEEDKTAVILPDENLLLPLLYALPPSVKNFNVTMGYPVKNSQAAHFFEALRYFQQSSKQTGQGEVMFYVPAVLNLLLHPSVVLTGKAQVYQLTEKLKQSRMVYVSKKSLLADATSPLDEFFQSPSTAQEVFEYLLVCFSIITGSMGSEAFSNPAHASLKFVYDELLSCRQLVSNHFLQIQTGSAWMILKRIIQSLKIPFSGEPVKGLQIMGFLESRALDFKNLIILSVNEDVLPRNQRGRSYIPAALRKGFQMPGRKESDASQSYHFFRLLHHAENVCLIYNTEVKSLKGGERSRYLLQIAYEMKKQLGDKLIVDHRLITTPLRKLDIVPVSIEKSGQVLNLLEKKFKSEKDEDQNGFSPTALSTYIYCPLRFYYRYVASITEPDSIEEVAGADVFGNILHKTMQRLYKDSSAITSSLIYDLLKMADSVTDEVFISEFPPASAGIEGRNYLLLDVLKHLIKRILTADLKEVPFELISLEQKLSINFKTSGLPFTVKIHGMPDRLEYVDGKLRIVDYKTGKDELSKEIDLEKIFSEPDQKALFQLLVYSLLVKRNRPGLAVVASIYSLRNIKSGLNYANNGNPILDSTLDEFSERISSMIREIFNSRVPFYQTSQEKRCITCPYNSICQRETGEPVN